MAAEDRGRRRIAAAVVVVLAAAAYLPSLSGDFLSDDFRFIVRNESVHELGVGQAFRYFSDVRTQATVGFDIYRPLRTLDFAIDWAIAGPSPLFFRIRNLLYHVLGSLLVLALLRRLAGEGGGAAALWGALFFAVHPVHTESVAFVSSRADLLMLCLVTGALILHLKDRPVAAALVLVPGLFAKEVAVVFPALALLADHHLRRRLAWRAYMAYGGLALAFTTLWFFLVARGEFAEAGQQPLWLGGNYFANVVTVGKGFLYDAKVLAFPVDLVFDWHVPSPSRPGVLDLAFSALGFGLLVLGFLRGGRARFAALWFFVAILPVSGLFLKMNIPTADRFLLLPSVGVALLAGSWLAGRRLSPVVLACFLALTVARGRVWQDGNTLIDATVARVETPLAMEVLALRGIQRVKKTGDPEDAKAVLRATDAFFRIYREEIHLPPPGGMAAVALTRRAEAYLHLRRPQEALRAAREALGYDEIPSAREAISVALEWLGDLEGAVREQDRAVANGLDGPENRRRLAEICVALAGRREAEGLRREAFRLYERAWEVFPDPRTNAAARRGIERLRR